MDIKGPPRPAKLGGPREQTLRLFLSENETQMHYITLLKELATRNARGPWREYLEFYRANQSGSIDSMAEDAKKKSAAIKKALEDEHFKNTNLD